MKTLLQTQNSVVKGGIDGPQVPPPPGSNNRY